MKSSPRDGTLSPLALKTMPLAGARLPEVCLVWADLKAACLARADLRGADLSGAYLYGADLRHARLHGACLEGAYLGSANLEGADLREAGLREARLPHANLRRANLKGVRDLHPDGLCGADLAETKWDTAPDWSPLLKRIEELSKNAGTPFVTSLVAIAFAWVTIGSTTDLALLTNTGTTKLPVVNLDIHLRGAFIVLPGVLLGIYVYFQLYLSQLWATFALLPAVFPDGRTVAEKTYPWLVGDLITRNLPRLGRGDRRASWLHGSLILVLGWFLLPFTLVALWGRYLPKHDLFGSLVQLVFAASGWALAAHFWQLTFARVTIPRNAARGRVLRLRSFMICCMAGGAVAAGLGWFTHRAITLDQAELQLPFLRTQASLYFVDAGPPQSAARKAPPRPAGSKSIRPFRPPGGYGAIFPLDSNLRGLNGRGAVLIGARLIGVDLTAAHLVHADLTDAELSETNLTRADLMNAGLYRAVLHRATLNAANLHLADLAEANLFRADLTGANLTDANLHAATLVDANLTGAKLQNADLTGANLIGADLMGAEYSPQTRWSKGFDPKARGAILLTGE